MERELESEVAKAKAGLRAELKARLEALDEAGARERAGRMQERVLALPEVVRSRRIFTCLSFGREIDTWGLVDRLLREGKEVFVPRTERGDPRIHVHRYPCPLRTLSFGLRQPVPAAPEVLPEAVDETLEVALILGLGFDRRGNRLGYGAGFFDRFLLGRSFPAVGLAYGFQLLDRLPTEPHDLPMAAVVTDESVLGAGPTGSFRTGP